MLIVVYRTFKLSVIMLMLWRRLKGSFTLVEFATKTLATVALLAMGFSGGVTTTRIVFNGFGSPGKVWRVMPLSLSSKYCQSI
jgi:hypothetical protein